MFIEGPPTMVNSVLAALGPGSQPSEDDAVLEYVQLPSGMMTYRMPALPEPEDVAGIGAALGALDQVLAALGHFKKGQPAYTIDLNGLDAKCRAFIDEALGEGEVGIVGGNLLQAQESVLAGVWRVRVMADGGELVRDLVEVGHLPNHINEIAFAEAHTGVRPPEGILPDGLLASPSLLAEIHNALTGPHGAAATHSINLSLLPHAEEDLTFLDRHLGRGEVHILSRGYGNCRISSTATRNVWWVRYYNSQDILILNSLEVAPIPDVAFAAVEDIHDSAERLKEILGVYR
jgi:hydrogenase-1 operon protein HyaF